MLCTIFKINEFTLLHCTRLLRLEVTLMLTNACDSDILGSSIE